MFGAVGRPARADDRQLRAELGSQVPQHWQILERLFVRVFLQEDVIVVVIADAAAAAAGALARLVAAIADVEAHHTAALEEEALR